MDLLQLRYFCYAAETESFAKAASRFRVPPSGISQSVKRLETELGQPLFERSANRIKLNEAGKGFYQKASEALEILDNAKNSLQKDNKKVLRVLVENNRHPVTLAAEGFTRDCPDVSLSFDYAAKEGVTYDIVVSARPLSGAATESIPLVTEPFALAVRRGHPLASLSRITGEELKDERFVCMSKNSSLYETLLSFCRAHGFTPTVALESDDPATVRHCIESGVGVGLVPAFSWRGQFSEAAVLIPVEGLTRTTRLYYRKDTALTPEKQAFLQALRAVFRQDP